MKTLKALALTVSLLLPCIASAWTTEEQLGTITSSTAGYSIFEISVESFEPIYDITFSVVNTATNQTVASIYFNENYVFADGHFDGDRISGGNWHMILPPGTYKMVVNVPFDEGHYITATSSTFQFGINNFYWGLFYPGLPYPYV